MLACTLSLAERFLNFGKNILTAEQHYYGGIKLFTTQNLIIFRIYEKLFHLQIKWIIGSFSTSVETNIDLLFPSTLIVEKYIFVMS